MKRLPRRAALAVLLCSVAGPLCFAATPEETRLLGSDQEAAQFESYMPFTRTLAAGGVVEGSLAQSAEAAGVPPAAMVEALAAFGSAIDLERELREGDRFYIRYERTYTAQGDAIGAGRVLWAELRTQAKGTLAIHRFRPIKASAESFWLSTGQAAVPAGLKLPLDTITVSSGFGMRADPFDQPARAGIQQWRGTVTPAGKAPLNNAPATKPPGTTRMAIKPLGGPPPASSPFTNPATVSPPLTVNVPTEAGIAAGLTPPGFGSFKGFSPRGPAMFMHEGVDLAADLGTPIHAAGDGVVKGAELKGGYGNWIEIEHDGLQLATPVPGKPETRPAKISTVYGHLSAFARGIEPGTKVKQGDVIGYVGSTGRSTGPHLHFEILQNGHPTNPMISQALRSEQLKGGELERFKKVIAKDLSARQREAGSI